MALQLVLLLPVYCKVVTLKVVPMVTKKKNVKNVFKSVKNPGNGKHESSLSMHKRMKGTFSHSWLTL